MYESSVYALLGILPAVMIHPVFRVDALGWSATPKYKIVFPRLPIFLFNPLEVIEMAVVSPLERGMGVLPVSFQ